MENYLIVTGWQEFLPIQVSLIFGGRCTEPNFYILFHFLLK